MLLPQLGHIRHSHFTFTLFVTHTLVTLNEAEMDQLHKLISICTEYTYVTTNVLLKFGENSHTQII